MSNRAKSAGQLLGPPPMAQGLPLEALEAMNHQIRMQDEAARQQTRVIALQLAVGSFGTEGAPQGSADGVEYRAERNLNFILTGRWDGVASPDDGAGDGVE